MKKKREGCREMSLLGCSLPHPSLEAGGRERESLWCGWRGRDGGMRRESLDGK